MFSGRRLRFKGPSRAAGDVARFPDEPKVLSPHDEGSSRMSDEGCPNESPSVDDATGYSKEEEEDNSIGCERSYDCLLREHSAVEDGSSHLHLETDSD
jgi:hypothetical protein